MRIIHNGIPCECVERLNIRLEMTSEEAGALRRLMDKCVDSLPDGHTLTISLPVKEGKRET